MPTTSHPPPLVCVSRSRSMRRVCSPTSHPPPLVCVSRSRSMRRVCPPPPILLLSSACLRIAFDEEGVPAHLPPSSSRLRIVFAFDEEVVPAHLPPSSSRLRIAFVFDEGRVCRPTSHPPPLVCASRSRLMRGGCAGHLPPSSRLRTTFNEEGVPATSTLLLFASSVTGGCTCAPHPRFVRVRFEEGVHSPPPLVCISGSVRVPTLLSFVYRVR